MRAPPLSNNLRNSTGKRSASVVADSIYCQWSNSWEDKASGDVSAEEFYDISTLIHTYQ